MSNVVTMASEQKWLDTADEVLQSNVARALESTGARRRPLQNLLHGTWLGHPLHPILISLPIGAWSVGLILDVMTRFGGRRALAHGADAAIAIGLASVVPTAAAGLLDWQHLQGRPRRLGALHAVLNIGASMLFATSLLARAARARGLGMFLASAGYGTIMASGYLGGELVFRERIGTDHAHRPEPSHTFTPVLPESEVLEGHARRVDVDGIPVLVTRVGGRVCAIGEVCSHLGGPLADGEIADGIVTCPWHASRFALCDGRVVDGPATFPQPRYEARVQNGQIELRALGDAA
jgi:nitrite reductase/ring-hydroxylating ferredoxin subunit/uncharacterized membrane protein